MDITSLAYFYYELVFNLSTLKNISARALIVMLFFSLAYGEIASLASSWSKKKGINIAIKSVFLLVPAVFCMIEYFVFRQFKMFYDLNTVTKGAGGAMTGFQNDIKKMVFSGSGITRIILFLLPVLVYLAVELFVDNEEKKLAARLTKKKLIIKGSVIIVSWILAIITIYTDKGFKATYTDRYSFEKAVGDFGFFTGVRKEVSRKVTGKNNKVSFESVEMPLMTPTPTAVPETKATENNSKAAEGNSDSEPVNTPTPTPEPVYGDNALDIDFEALADSDSGTYAELDAYVASLTPTKQNRYTGLFKGKNLIFLSAEAFCAEVIDEELTPTLYRLATKGINFTDYYQPASAGTTGGEYENLMGMLPTEGGASMKMTATYNNYFTISSQLNRLGYYGKAYHNNDYTFYDRDQTHNNLGYSDGFMGIGNGMEAYVNDDVWPESDLEMIEGTLSEYIDKQPFDIYYMTVSGHSSYSVADNDMTKKNWDRVQGLNYSDPVKAYIAANLELEDALTLLVKTLEEKGIADDTVIVLGADHFPYGLDSEVLGDLPMLSELYGYNVTDYLNRDHNRLIIWSGCLEKEDPIIVDTPTFSLDILPTLSNLFGVQWDSRLLPGRDVLSDAPALVFDINYDWKTEYGHYYAASDEFYPFDDSIELPEGYVDAINTIVKNKMNYCVGVLNTDYFGHLYDQGVLP